jgi:amidohydrolase
MTTGPLNVDATDIAAWRHDLHRNPELLYAVERTAGFVAERLREFGCDEVVTGIGRTGVVGLIRGRGASARTIGLRADMDALPITEATGLAYQSVNPGKMHACGHDGHTAMLLGAARQLSAARDFAGTAALIFQPAEEGGAGARAMIDDGLMDRFGIAEIYGLHNMPGLPAGHFAIRPGPQMAAADRFDIVVEGKGAHAALPHQGVDPIVVAAQIVGALQGIVSRGIDPLEACVVSVTRIKAGSAYNVIPQEARLAGTVRTLKAETSQFAEGRLREIAEGVARAHRASARVSYSRGYPVTLNHAAQTAFAAEAARGVAGAAQVNADCAPVMGAEDFSYMLEARPGAFIFLGNGDSAGLHHPAYDFNDAIIPAGVSYWVRLVEARLQT